MTENELRTQLHELAMNLWWTWSPPARRLMSGLDTEAWRATGHDALAVIDGLSDERLRECAGCERFRDELETVLRLRRDAIEGETWFDRNCADAAGLRIAYFCSEFGLHESIPQYAGGLGILAGDHLRSASDLGIPLVGVGIVYHGGYYRQGIEADGSTRVDHPEFDPDRSPMRDTGHVITVPMGDGTVSARVLRMEVGRCPLYLLDADIDANSEADRALSGWLYGGDPTLRMRRQMLLGVGGAMALQAVGESVTVDHLNEGHAAFVCVQRLREAIEAGLEGEAAMEAVRSRTVFTTHTPVPAGHDRYDIDAVVSLLEPITSPAGIDDTMLADLGREHPGANNEQFCMTVLALRCSSRVNAVSRLHRRVTKEMWQDIYGLEHRQAIPIMHVTNGIHLNAWMHSEAWEFWRRQGLDLETVDPELNLWEAAGEVDPAELWALRNTLRANFIEELRRRVEARARRLGTEVDASNLLDPDALTIGFARRFATYKRAPLVFHDPARLSAIIGDPDRPVQLVFAGKAHPDDLGGQDYLRQVFEHAGSDVFRDRVVVLEDYDIALGRSLVSGCDLWLNTPIRPREASGTSGMKVPIHGGMNVSIPDGWWPEAMDGTNGWSFGSEEEFDDPGHRDRRDVDELYTLLESEIVPAYYERDQHGLPSRWLHRVRRSAVTVPPVFNTHRMLAQYLEQAYLPTHRS